MRFQESSPTLDPAELISVLIFANKFSTKCFFCRQSLCFRIQKMMEVYRPDWCETRDDWSVFLFSPQNKSVLSLSTLLQYIIAMHTLLKSCQQLFHLLTLFTNNLCRQFYMLCGNHDMQRVLSSFSMKKKPISGHIMLFLLYLAFNFYVDKNTAAKLVTNNK